MSTAAAAPAHDSLDQMARDQAEFRRVAGNPDFAALLSGRAPSELTDDERELVIHWHRNYALALMMESSELMDWVPWKHWSRQLGNKQPVEPFSAQHVAEIRTELADLMCFIHNMCALWGITPDELIAAVAAKVRVNHQRQATGSY